MKDVHDLEIYAPIKDFPNYLVTSRGRIMSLKDSHNNNRILEIKQRKNKNNGYMFVNLYKNNKMHSKTVHRLVAQAFISNPEKKPQVNHIDEDKTNNHVSNLEWVSHKENCNHGTRNERIREKTNCKKIIAKSLMQSKVMVFKSTFQVKKFGFEQSAVSRCCNGKSKSHKGYTWQFIDDKDKK